jgi:Uma2 family endonuclease
MQTLVIPTPTDTPGVYGPPQGEWTAADWEKLPDDGNIYEVIEGFLYMSKPRHHTWLHGQLMDFIGMPAKEFGAYSALTPVAVCMDGCDPVQPDFVLLSQPHVHQMKNFQVHGVPDLIIEITRHKTNVYKEVIKLNANAGVPEYIILDPIESTLTHCHLAEVGCYEKIVKRSASDFVRFTCIPSLELYLTDFLLDTSNTTL